MSTTPITCPKCDGWVRVAVQPSKIEAEVDGATGEVIQLRVSFHEQVAAHTCKKGTK